MEPNQITIVLSYNEAIARDEEIVKSARNLRENLLYMYEHDGWRALGKSSWSEYLQDVGYRAGYTSKTLHKVTRAALLESGAGWRVGTFPEGAIRPISDGLSNRKGFSEQDRIDALELAITWAGGEGEVTSTHSHMAVAYLTVSQGPHRRLSQRMHAGEVPAIDALKIAEMIEHTEDNKLRMILEEVSDVPLASALFNLSNNGHEKWEDIEEQIMATGCIPGARGKQVPISEANHAFLVGYLSEPYYLERAEDYATQRDKMMAVCHAARQVILHEFDGKEPDISKHPYQYLMYLALKEANMM